MSYVGNIERHIQNTWFEIVNQQLATLNEPPAKSFAAIVELFDLDMTPREAALYLWENDLCP